jgi:hypothetical protein
MEWDLRRSLRFHAKILRPNSNSNFRDVHQQLVSLTYQITSTEGIYYITTLGFLSSEEYVQLKG